MSRSRGWLCTVVGGVMALAMIAGSPLLAAEVAHKGVDVWTTMAGFAKTSFDQDPVPAGFFCEGSQPFAGRIVMKGVPLATRPAHGLGSADTVVRRLDDAVFDGQGKAVTRIRLEALSLASVEPIATSCGAYDVAVHLDGAQPTTTMRIVKTNEYGGRYSAPLALNVRVVFTPVAGNPHDRRELTRRIDLGPGSNSIWAFTRKPRYSGPILIDTNGDGRPDTRVPRASNFVAGLSPTPKAALASWIVSDGAMECPEGTCLHPSCHCNPDEDNWDPWETRDGCDDDHQHCIWTCVDPSTAPAGMLVECYESDSPIEGPPG